MAHRPVNDAHHTQGTDLQYLVEKEIRTRIYGSKYWKEECLGLTDELLTERAADLTSVGGLFGSSSQPTAFLCLTLKMLQMRPHRVVVVEFIRNEDFRYARALGALYMRLTGSARDCREYLEPLHDAGQNLRVRTRSGDFASMRVSEFIYELLHSQRVCGIRLPPLQERRVLQGTGPRELPVSALGQEAEAVSSTEEEDVHGGQLESDPSGCPRRHSHRDPDRGSQQTLHGRSQNPPPRRRQGGRGRPGPYSRTPRHRCSESRGWGRNARLYWTRCWMFPFGPGG